MTKKGKITLEREVPNFEIRLDDDQDIKNEVHEILGKAKQRFLVRKLDQKVRIKSLYKKIFSFMTILF